ncbi:MAG TPA: NAD(P)H-dependent oxidoreductase subunit E [Euzebyales bacterium]|nr:NAD(P)H-dependent oxidoreductase subunit E [Euzebyales bacterium]
MFSTELREKAEELLGRYPVSRSALLPLLHLVQSQDGYLSDDGITECAQLLGLTKAEVAAVATFYSMYKRAPLGRHLVSVCTNFSCKVRGAQEVYDRLSDKLGVGHNETTPDGSITLEHAECLGNCEGAPVVTVDYYNYECLTPEGAEQLVDRVIAGDVPEPTRGQRSPGIREISHRLAGLGPHPDDVQRGERLGYARAAAGGAPPPEAANGSGADLQVVSGDVAQGQGREHAQAGESEFSDQREAQRAAARGDIRSAGQDPDEVEEEGGPDAREFPSRDPDIEPDDDESGSDA